MRGDDRDGREDREQRVPGRADRVDFHPDHDPADPVLCEVCGGVMRYMAGCKLRCPGCGYTRDCSDP